MIEHVQNLLLRLREAADAARIDSESTLESSLYIWLSGGWAMIVLAAIALFIFAIGFGVLLRLRSKGFRGISEATWRRWIHEPEDRSGTVGGLFDEVSRLTEAKQVEVSEAFDELRTHEVEPFIRDLRLMNIAVGAAPLVGLLGTVTGMLSTFKALAAGSGGDKTMAMIAEGISEALYTTETGLVVALPGLFFHYYLSRKFGRYKDFLGHAETVWHQKSLDDRERAVRDAVRTAARGQVADRLRERLAATASTAGTAATADR